MFSNTNTKEFKIDVEEIFNQIGQKLKILAIEISQNQSETEQANQINKMACQFYASLLNKIENGNLTVLKFQINFPDSS